MGLSVVILYTPVCSPCPLPVAQIAASIREFGFTNPVLIDGAGTIIAGHGRVMAARKLGLDEVPCIRLGHLTPQQVKAYVIADNKLALNAGWDAELLKVELETLKDEGYSLDVLGFTPEEIDDIMLGDVGRDQARLAAAAHMMGNDLARR